MSAPIQAGFSQCFAVEAGNSWHALTVKHNFECAVGRHLNDRGFESFVPLYQARRQWSDRVKTIDLPLFSGYVFSSFDSRCRHFVDRIPGVTGLVSFGREAAVVDPVELNGIRAVMRSGLYVEPWPFLGTGRKVSIERGPLKGLSGIVERTKSSCRLVLSVTMLNRSVVVELDRDWVLPIAS